MNVSEFDDATAASEALISTMQAFQYTAEDSQHVVDILNEVGNNYAVSSDGIATALKDSASALMEGGNSMEQAVALVAAANRVVQDPSSVGSALRTISLRLRGTSVEILEEMGEETDGVAESTSKLQEKLKALTGVDILTDAGSYKDTYTILKEIGEVWQNLDPMDQAAALELMAGKNRANTLAAILNNMKDLEGAYESAQNAEGSALKENAAYLDSIQGRIDLFNNAVQTMWMNFMNDDVLKFLVDVGTKIVTLADNVGLLETALGVFAGFTTAKDSITNRLAEISRAKTTSDVFSDTWTGKSIAKIKELISAKKAQKKASEEAAASQNAENVAHQQAVAAEQGELGTTKQLIVADKQEEKQNKRTAASQNAENVAQKAAASLSVTAAKGIARIGSVLLGGIKGVLIGAAFTIISDLLGNILQPVIDGVTDFFKSAETKAAELKETVDEMKQTYVDAKQELDDNLQTLTTPSDTSKYDDLYDEFEDLANGVNDYGKNISLTADEYERYVEICNLIVGINPSIASGYNNAAEAVANNAGALKELIEFEKERARLAAAEYVSNGRYAGNDNWESLVENAYNEQKTVAQELYKYTTFGDDVVKSLSDVFKEGLKLGNDDLSSFGDNLPYDDIMNMIMKSMGYTEAQITEVDSKYRDSLSGLIDNDWFNKWSKDYANEIYESKDNLLKYIEKLKNDDSAIGDPETFVYNALSFSGEDFNGGGWNGKGVEDVINQFITYDKETQDYLFDYIKFSQSEYGGYIGAYKDHLFGNFETLFDDWADGFGSVAKEAEDARDGLIDEFLEVPNSIKGYYDLDSGIQSYITEWIKNDESFKLQEGLEQEEITEWSKDQKDNIEKVVNDIISGNQLLKDAFNEISTLNTAEYTFEEYKSKVETLLDNIYTNLGDETKELLELSEDKDKYRYQLAVNFGLEWVLNSDGESDSDTSNVDSLVAELLTIVNEDEETIRNKLNSLPPLEVKRMMEYDYSAVSHDDPDTPDVFEGTSTFEDVHALANAIVKSSKLAADAYSTLDEKVSTYKETLSQVNGITSDHTTITQELKDEIDALNLSEEQMTEIFGEENGLIVKNAKALNDYSKAASKVITDDVKLAKSHAQLQYYELIQQLGDTINVTEDLSAENKNAANSLLEQIDAVKSSIQQYQLLEDSLLGVTNAYEKFAAAQEMDAQNTYGDNYVEMAQTMYDALYKTGEVGTEQFWAAAEALVPDNIYQDLESGYEQVKAIYDYFNKNVLPTMTLEEDQFSLDFDSLENFVEEAQKAGIFTDTGTKEFVFSQEFIDGIADGTNGLKKLAEQMGMTEYQAYAMLAELEKYNTNDLELSFIAQMDKTTTGKIMNVTNELERLNKQKLALLEGGYDKNKGEIDVINEAIKAQQAILDGLNAEATESVQAYTDIGNALIALEGVSTQAGATVKDAMPESVYTKLGLTGDETVQEACDKLQADLLKLEEPTTVTLEIAKQNIEDQIAEIEKSDVTIKAEVQLNEDGLYEIKDGSTYGDTKTLETYVGLLNDQTFISSLLESSVSTNDILSNIDANVASIAEKAKEEEPSDEPTEEKEPDKGKTEEIPAPQPNPPPLTPTSTPLPSEAGAGGVVTSPPGDFIQTTITPDTVNVTGTNVEFETVPEPQPTLPPTPTPPPSDTSGGVFTPGQAYIDPATLSGPIISDIVLKTDEAEDQLNKLDTKIDETFTVDDPLGIQDVDTNLIALMDSLDELGVQYDSHAAQWWKPWGDVALDINVPDLVAVLRSKGWSDGAIQSYIQQLSTDLQIEGVQIKLEGAEDVEYELGELSGTEVDDKTVDVNVNGADEAKDELKSVDAAAKNITHTVTTVYKSQYQTVGGTSARLPGSGGRYTMFANGTAHADGTAYSSGDWGAPKTETALGGELGVEMRVRDGRWELIGQNGAEFFDVKKGDIIFNHKQTEELLKNGYVTGRGKAYASGTVGGAAYSGLWGPTSPDESLSNTAGSEIGDAAGKLSKAASDISKSSEELSEDFKEVFDWIEVRLEEITEDISLKSAQLENKISISSKNAVIDDMIELNQKLYNNLTAGAKRYNDYAAKLLQNIPSAYRKAAQDGSIAIESFTGEVGEKTLEAIQNYREWVQKGADVTQQAEETLTEISNLAKQAIDNIIQGYENKTSIPRAQIEQLEAYNSLIETTVGAESSQIYNEIINRNNEIIRFLTNQRNKMQTELNEQVKAGNIKKYSQAWYDVINDIAAVDTEIIELTTDTKDYQDTINELHWDHFDNLISRLEAVSNESENLIDILSSKDLVNQDTVEWTDEGITSLALYAQQMEVAEVQAKKYKEEIDYLNDNWQALGYTEQEYAEKLEELKSGQYDAIKSYNDTKEAIKDLTSERIDAIKRGIEKEIDAYSELIEKKKEELSAEKDLYDFQRGVADQQKEIADIERKLAALSADNSASARAQRAQLQAELAKAQQELQDTYYDRSVSDQQEALDKELESFRDEKDAEMESLDEYLENTEQVVADSLTIIQENTDVVYQTLQAMSQEYSLSIADAITSPWEDGSAALQDYSEKFKLTMSSTVEELQKLSTEYKKIMSEIENTGTEAVENVSDNVSGYTDTKSSTQQATTASRATTQYDTYTVQSGDSLWAIAENKLGDGSRWQEIYNLNKDQIIDPNVISKGQKLKIPKYAKGTKGILTNQLAWIDELGEELVLRPQNGRLSFMEKGTSVIPADLTENLMEWGELDPSVMLERNRPEIKLHPEVHNTEVNITMDISEVVHIDRVDNENMPDLTKAVEKQLDKYMKNLNNQIRRYVR